MTTPAPFVVIFSPDVALEDRDALLVILRRHGELREPTTRTSDPSLVDSFVTILSDLGEFAGDVGGFITLANAIRVWRQQARERGSTPAVQLERPHQPPLDLATATDQQFLEWLLQQPPQS